MTTDDIVAAFALPASAVRPTRIPKTVLNERGAATSADRKLIDAGVDRLDWISTLSPASTGVAASNNEERPVPAIQLLTLAMRAEPTQRLLTIIHRAIPLPVILITSHGTTTRVSLAPLRRAERIEGAMVVERIVTTPAIAVHDATTNAFLASLAVATLSRTDLAAVYEALIWRVEAFAAARIGSHGFRLPVDPADASARRAALADHDAISAEFAKARSAARAEKMLSRQVSLAEAARVVKMRLNAVAKALR